MNSYLIADSFAILDMSIFTYFMFLVLALQSPNIHKIKKTSFYIKKIYNPCSTYLLRNSIKLSIKGQFYQVWLDKNMTFTMEMFSLWWEQLNSRSHSVQRQANSFWGHFIGWHYSGNTQREFWCDWPKAAPCFRAGGLVCYTHWECSSELNGTTKKKELVDPPCEHTKTSISTKRTSLNKREN